MTKSNKYRLCYDANQEVLKWRYYFAIIALQLQVVFKLFLRSRLRIKSNAHKIAYLCLYDGKIEEQWLDIVL
jgi:1-acyl-sn-glycerol-3-phosphate acyltransferase